MVSAADVLAARKGEASLPPRALLITFDDGWKDNADFALPRLRKARLPALLFVVADVIGRRLPFFQEQLMAGWRLGRIDAERLLQVTGQKVVAREVPSGPCARRLPRWNN